MMPIGDVKVTLIRETLQSVPATGMYTNPDMAVFEANADWLKPHFMEESGNLPLSIHALVLESEGQTVMVDTCIGNRPIEMVPQMSHLGTGFLDELAAAGYEPPDIDVVLCTHLHFDHVGWNTILVDAKWVPAFPNARYLFNRTEYDYWDSGAEGAAVTFGDAVQPVMEAGLADLVDSHHQVTGEIRLMPTPGHTPGHVSVQISSRGQEAVITGDLVHHPVQFAAPDWIMTADDDPSRASATRVEFRERYADSGVLILGTHFAGPGCGHLSRTGNRWVFQAPAPGSSPGTVTSHG
ncbi:MBL fold metallo-hydrolase [Candidatus Poriferisocius sp.]|uniref:MBL fold metallo-hydrolase n=1 Tax=Candidatus Poriferisocius sp. TaxID=3101276 RepID=UPI003B014D84